MIRSCLEEGVSQFDKFLPLTRHLTALEQFFGLEFFFGLHVGNDGLVDMVVVVGGNRVEVGLDEARAGLKVGASTVFFGLGFNPPPGSAGRI